MSGQSTPAQSKRQLLTAIVSRLGPDATPADIRQEAYRIGFGAVNSAMMTRVRNDAFPDRTRRSNGRRNDGADRGGPSYLATSTGPVSVPCPSCAAPWSSIRGRHPRKDGDVSVRRKCRVCRLDFGTVESPASLPPSGQRSREVNRLAAATATERRCTSCGTVRPVEEFGRKSDGVLLRSHCRGCSAEKRAEHSFRASLARFGITPEEYASVLASQGGACAICGSEGAGKGKGRFPLCFDHCHATGKFRGLLCDRCNLGLGNFDDDVARFRKATEYLERHQL